MKAKLYYSIDEYAEEFDRLKTKYEACLHFYWVEGDNNTFETLIGRGASFEEAKADVIARFKSLPPTEEIDI